MDNRKQDLAGPMPAMDEGWWEAVLAEEGSQDAARAPRSSPRSTPRGDQKAEQRPQPNWDKAKALFGNDEIVEMRVTASNRGGLLVDGDQLNGFVPFSHLVGVPGMSQVSDRSRMLEAYVGRTLRLKVIECAPEDGRIVLSERAAQSEPGKRAQIFHTLKAGRASSRHGDQHHGFRCVRRSRWC